MVHRKSSSRLETVELADRTAHRQQEADAAGENAQLKTMATDDLETRPSKSNGVDVSIMYQPVGNESPGPGSSPDQKKHVRFGSEDSAEGDSGLLNGARHEASAAVPADSHEDVEDSSDEAPEAISATKGQEAARAFQRDAVKAVNSQRRAVKAARRKNDSRLKSQASSQKARKRESEPALDTNKTADKLAQDILDSGELPDFLPAEILNAESVPVQALTARSLNDNKRSKRKQPTNVTKSYKDVAAGDRVIRVLSKPLSSLPPRVSKVSKNVRESWLRGSTGGTRIGTFQQKPFKRGLVNR